MTKMIRKTMMLWGGMMIAVVFLSGSVFAQTERLVQDENQTGTITIAVEKFTLGEGYFIEPQQIPVYAGDTGITVLDRFLGSSNIVWKNNYLVGLYGAQTGEVKVPDCISKMQSHADFGDAPTTESALAEGLTYPDRLSEKDYSPMSGWMYSVNNAFPGYGLDGYTPADGDVFRLQFTLWGYGADLGQDFQGGMTPINQTDKTALTKLLAEINSSSNKSEYMKDATFKTLYDQADAMMANLEATTKQVRDLHDQLKAAIPEISEPVSVTYHTHIQNVGWEKDWKNNGEMSGTSGRSLRLEGIEVKLDGAADYDLGIQYKTHIENIGWEKDWKRNGDMSGTKGQGLRLEGIEIALTGSDANQFDVYYQVHAQNFGWLDWAQNGANAGTAGFGYRLEGIRVVVVPKGEAAPGPTARPFVDKNLV
ncbi:putative membrane protein [Acetobacterium woodii DSM 1030]|uniref:Putative membrane protein n=2 Tax=Acetobacterium woodii TaxID=33952 RepID=H6LIQ3_ACEWD|nr:putative membrane protein [Acetobacterium woodii DSM 1030]